MTKEEKIESPVRLRESTREKLKKLPLAGITYDDKIQELIKFFKSKKG